MIFLVRLVAAKRDQDVAPTLLRRPSSVAIAAFERRKRILRVVAFASKRGK